LKQFTLEGKNPAVSFLIIYGFCLFLSILFLLLATKSSPLYPFNDWVDVNASFTMGKGMMNGKILYRDIFDQRGPLFYLLFGIAYLLANTSFIGIFLFEVIAFSIFLFFSFKLLFIFLDFYYSLIALPLIASSILNLRSFAQGGSPEEFCLPLITISLYYLFIFFKNVYPKEMPNRWVFINGILAGCVLWIKFSLLGFWFGWMASTFICMLINNGFHRAIKGPIVFIVGMLTATLPWIGYFGINHSIFEWINSYIFINLTSYSEAISLVSIIKFSIIGILTHLVQNPVIIGLLYFGLIVFIIYKKFIHNFFNKFSLLFCFLFLALSVFGGGRNYIYYFLIFSPFIIFGYIVLLTLFYEKFGVIKFDKLVINIIIILIIAFFFIRFNSIIIRLCLK